MKKYYWIKPFESSAWEVACFYESTNYFRLINGGKIHFDKCFCVHFEEIVPPGE